MKVHIIMSEYKYQGQYDVNDKHFQKLHELLLKMSKDEEATQV